MAALSSAVGVIALLDETNPQLKSLALQKLDLNVSSFWHEIADVVQKIETLYEDKDFSDRKLAAIVASKVYFHLGSYSDALTLALGAEDLFDVNLHTEYVETIIAKCIDHYTLLRNKNAEAKEEKDTKPIDPRLEGIVDRMFNRCFAHKQFKQAIGIALETRRLDMLERALKESDDTPGLLAYCVKTVLALIQNRKYRNEILQRLVNCYSKLPQPDYINVCQCLIFLENPQSVADILEKLLKEKDTTLKAYQIAFDLYESATQQFIGRILQSLKKHEKPDEKDQPVAVAKQPASRKTTPPHSPPPAKRSGTPPPKGSTTPPKGSTTPTKGTTTPPKGATSPSKDTTTPPKRSTTPTRKNSATGDDDSDDEFKGRLSNLIKILSGNETVTLHLQFLIKNNKTDMLILKSMKDVVRTSIFHTATVITNGFMYAGTTCDDFLRENLDWVGKATNWAKFTAVASLGVIHKGHESDPTRLLEPYLPKENAVGSSGYMEGGSLYALGLIHANHGQEKIIEYLKTQLRTAKTDNVRHGACLGLGLAAMGTHNNAVYDELKQALYQDDAVTGEAAGLAMGLVMLGSHSSTATADMIQYAADTQHEKTLRGLCVGLSLITYGRLEEANTLIENLSRDKDPLMRRAGVYALAMAYCGTGSNEAVRRLLHIAVSDVNDDVRRAAVTCLGFLLYRTPEQCPTIVSLLAESFNPHVRYGATMALGIACAGTGMKEVLSLLEPMLNDAVSYVRQGAMIALAMVMMQHNEVSCPKVKDFRATLTKVITDKHEDVMAKFGAIVAQGILDAGGRNVTISLQTRNGHTDTSSVVGMLVFLQYWFWFPLTHFLSMAFQPTCLIALNSDLKVKSLNSCENVQINIKTVSYCQQSADTDKMPKLEFRSNARPSLFAYPPALEEKKEKQAEKVETAVLSITAKQKKKEKDRQTRGVSSAGSDKMDVDEPSKEPAAKPKDKVMEIADKDKTEPSVSALDKTSKTMASAVEPEPSFQMLNNPARVLKQQLKLVTFNDSRFEPLKNVTLGGIIMLKDRKSDLAVEFVDLVKGGGAHAKEEEDEPEPPAAFEYSADEHTTSTPSRK